MTETKKMHSQITDSISADNGWLAVVTALVTSTKLTYVKPS